MEKNNIDKIHKNLNLLRISCGFVIKQNIICLCIALYQFTRPFDFDSSYYYKETKKTPRHEILNKFLSNFILNFSIKR